MSSNISKIGEQQLSSQKCQGTEAEKDPKDGTFLKCVCSQFESCKTKVWKYNTQMAREYSVKKYVQLGQSYKSWELYQIYIFTATKFHQHCTSETKFNSTYPTMQSGLND